MIDPHTHSTASDGTTPPAVLMHEAAAAGVTMLGLTDHDTVAGWDEAAGEVANTGVALIRGMEVSAAYRGISLHMLAYLFDPASPELTDHIWPRPGICPNCCSSGPVTAEVITSGLAPG